MNVHPKFILRIRWLICGYTIFAVFKLKMASLFHIYFRSKLYHMHTQFSQLFSQNQNILRNGFSWTNIYQSCDTVTLTKRKLGNAPPIFLVSIFVSTVCTAHKFFFIQNKIEKPVFLSTCTQSKTKHSRVKIPPQNFIPNIFLSTIWKNNHTDLRFFRFKKSILDFT